ncbi:Starch-binding associating with outer membrane [Sinomicrobium oceani]|uniref:Starch-binding associating with outer membrane n=1 Tax=Sinomicrobium oceani TaxID=1150368 RepID=A0A1K1P1U8_9FLAO|nr:RagB/SusD family nutrient uptake outer membrane protein [Sinomicrobium oceani]SFW41497.1 Starch-binding associating with outer membrane [Sinomicrobium oceani]
MKLYKYILASFILLSLWACDLDESPVATANGDAIFGSESGMELYVNSFYDNLPGTDTGVFTIDNTSDYVARRGVDSYLVPNALSPITSTGWSWGALRNINYFIKNAETSEVGTKENYIGLARFFRALFYFEKVKRFGDVPWIEVPIEVQDSTTLYASRDNRFEVMENVLDDLNYAIENIALTSDPSCSRITRNVARAYKTRICLYEASFRKYHTGYGMQGTAESWYQEVIDEANSINGFSLHQAADNTRSYRELFITPSPFADETILAVLLDPSLQIYNSANRRFISPTYGDRPSITRNFVNTYLKLDGTPFTDNPDYEATPFAEEVKDRDLRLQQTIRLGDYQRTENGTPVIAPPNLSQSYTGYQPIKWCYDERFPYDDESRNDNAHIIMRWAEVLLNKAEALAELGKMNDAEWATTIGALRERAGIAGPTLTSMPVTADPYMVAYYKGKFTNPVLLEVLRERAIELTFEGLRPDDLRRWHLGELFEEAPMNGIYVAALGEQDLNGDGIMDVCFYQGERPQPSNPSVVMIDVSSDTSEGGRKLSNGSSGELIYNPGQRQWEDRKYLYPIPQGDYEQNTNLGQNPGWE